MNAPVLGKPLGVHPGDFKGGGNGLGRVMFIRDFPAGSEVPKVDAELGRDEKPPAGWRKLEVQNDRPVSVTSRFAERLGFKPIHQFEPLKVVEPLRVGHQGGAVRGNGVEEGFSVFDFGGAPSVPPGGGGDFPVSIFGGDSAVGGKADAADESMVLFQRRVEKGFGSVVPDKQDLFTIGEGNEAALR